MLPISLAGPDREDLSLTRDAPATEPLRRATPLSLPGSGDSDLAHFARGASPRIRPGCPEPGRRPRRGRLKRDIERAGATVRSAPMPGVRTPHWQLIRAPVAVYDAHGGGKGASVLTREELGRRIACERERAGLTQGQLAERVGLDRSAINRIERGQVRITSTRSPSSSPSRRRCCRCRGRGGCGSAPVSATRPARSSPHLPMH